MRFLWLLAVSVMGQELFTGAPVERELAAGAKVSLAKGGNRAWRHPYFWAPFVFVGEEK